MTWRKTPARPRARTECTPSDAWGDARRPKSEDRKADTTNRAEAPRRADVPPPRARGLFAAHHGARRLRRAHRRSAGESASDHSDSDRAPGAPHSTGPRQGRRWRPPRASSSNRPQPASEARALGPVSASREKRAVRRPRPTRPRLLVVVVPDVRVQRRGSRRDSRAPRPRRATRCGDPRLRNVSRCPPPPHRHGVRPEKRDRSCRQHHPAGPRTANPRARRRAALVSARFWPFSLDVLCRPRTSPRARRPPRTPPPPRRPRGAFTRRGSRAGARAARAAPALSPHHSPAESRRHGAASSSALEPGASRCALAGAGGMATICTPADASPEDSRGADATRARRARAGAAPARATRAPARGRAAWSGGPRARGGASRAPRPGSPARLPRPRPGPIRDRSRSKLPRRRRRTRHPRTPPTPRGGARRPRLPARARNREARRRESRRTRASRSGRGHPPPAAGSTSPRSRARTRTSARRRRSTRTPSGPRWEARGAMK